MLRDWIANGEKSLGLAIDAMTTSLESAPDTTYRRLAEKLIGTLSTNERVTASLAAILDRRVGDIAMYEAAGITKAAALQTLTSLLDRKALRDTPSGIEWVNPSVRAHAYVTILPSIRTLLHAVVLTELERRLKAGQEIPHLEIAWHSFRAGHANEGSGYLVAGAAAALRAGAPTEAERALESAMPEISQDEKARAAMLLAEALQEQARFDESAKYLDIVS
ncbi:MAG TPA: hypothetical protein VJU17_08370, partial [Gemmatimonadales bacterium]|nr:hypothetical protein [Gemmatimonadales bacterium]